MDESVPKRPTPIDLFRWLLIVVLVFGVYFLPAEDVENAVPPLAEIEKPTIPETPRAVQEPPDAVLSTIPETPFDVQKLPEAVFSTIPETPCTVQEPLETVLSTIPAVDPAVDEDEKPTGPFHSIIIKAAARYEVDAALVKAIIKAESGYDPQAVSHKGAKGLMQLMPRTARSMGLKEDMFNPERNIETGVKYFKKLLDRFDGDVSLALAAYNAGMRRVREHKGIPPIRATRSYVKKVLRYYSEYKQETETVAEQSS